MTKFIIEQLRKENAFLNDMLENAHNRSRLLEKQLQQAHRQGWEQCKVEAARECHARKSGYALGAEYVADSLGRAIAAMEYKTCPEVAIKEGV